MERIHRVGPIVHGQVRTVEYHGGDVEILDTEPATLSSWKATRGAQRYLCIELTRKKLNVFVPLDYFERGERTVNELVARSQIVEGGAPAPVRASSGGRRNTGGGSR